MKTYMSCTWDPFGHQKLLDVNHIWYFLLRSTIFLQLHLFSRFYAWGRLMWMAFSTHRVPIVANGFLLCLEYNAYSGFFLCNYAKRRTLFIVFVTWTDSGNGYVEFVIDMSRAILIWISLACFVMQRLDILEALEAAVGDLGDMRRANHIFEVQRDFNE